MYNISVKILSEKTLPSLTFIKCLVHVTNNISINKTEKLALMNNN